MLYYDYRAIKTKKGIKKESVAASFTSCFRAAQGESVSSSCRTLTWGDDYVSDSHDDAGWLQPV